MVPSATLTIDGVTREVTVYARKMTTSKKDGFGVLGKVTIAGVRYQLNGTLSPITKTAKEPVAATPAKL